MIASVNITIARGAQNVWDCVADIEQAAHVAGGAGEASAYVGGRVGDRRGVRGALHPTR